MPRRKPMTAEDRAWIQGFAVALRHVATTPAEPSYAADIAVSHGITLADLRQARVPASDVAPFRKELREREQRRNSALTEAAS